MGRIPNLVERHLLPPTCNLTETPNYDIRCLRHMGLQRLVQDVLVPDPIGRDSTPPTIAEKELRGVGECWEGHRVTYFCDNQVVVASLSSKTSKHPDLMHLVRCLAFV